MRSSSTPPVAHAGLVLLVAFALCSFLLSSGPVARHHGRYGPDGQLRGEILADMVLMVQTAANCGFSAVSRLSTSPSWFRGSSLWSLRPKRFTSGAWIRWLMPLIMQVVLTVTCTVFGVRLRSTRCGFSGRGLPELFHIQHSLV